MPYVYTKEFIPQANEFMGFGAFGQSAPANSAVRELQRALKQVSVDLDNTDYDPGPVDGRYGRNTHAALIRVGRDMLGWTAGPGCQSQCNTLRSAVQEVCADCIAEALPQLADKMPATGLSLSSADVAAIVGAYKDFLNAYIAEYGEGGELDPLQIARRDGMSIEEATEVAEARRAAAEGSDTVATTAGSGTTNRPGQQLQQAGFSWWWVVLFAGIGSGLVYMAYEDKKKQKAAAGGAPKGRRIPAPEMTW
jgi:hypothetical protein